MSVATGCGCKEVYRFPHTTYRFSSCICSFSSSIPIQFFKMFFLLFVLYNFIIRPGGAGPVAQDLAGPIFAYVVIIIKYNTPEREINSLIDPAALSCCERSA